jgi:hypothetical protein
VLRMPLQASLIEGPIIEPGAGETQTRFSFHR